MSPNPYYHPEELGLVPMVQVEATDDPYSYDTFCVWRDGASFAWADDEGCSCPVPFEDSILTRGNAQDALADLKAWALSKTWVRGGGEAFWRECRDNPCVQELVKEAGR